MTPVKNEVPRSPESRIPPQSSQKGKLSELLDSSSKRSGSTLDLTDAAISQPLQGEPFLPFSTVPEEQRAQIWAGCGDDKVILCNCK